VLQGAPVVTQDLDVVHSRDPDNLQRLLMLGAIGDPACDYAQLLPETVEMEAGPGATVRVLELGALIRLTEQTATEKDRATLPVLRRTLEERQNRG